MKKYFQVIKNTWEEYFVYRLNFVMWRIRTVLQLLTIYFLWLAIFSSRGGETLFGYTASLMLTYILGTALLRAVIFATRTLDVGEQINRGELSNFLLRPINYFLYKASQDVADKAMNIFFAIFEIGIIFLVLAPPIFIQTDLLTLTFFLIAVVLGVVLYFLTSFLLGIIGFWSPEIWGPRFIFFILSEFLAGGLFPLDILPKQVFFLLTLLPFPYLLYFPLKIYLGGLSAIHIVGGITISLFWIIVMYYITRVVWQRGLAIYESVGR